MTGSVARCSSAAPSFPSVRPAAVAAARAGFASRAAGRDRWAAAAGCPAAAIVPAGFAVPAAQAVAAQRSAAARRAGAPDCCGKLFLPGLACRSARCRLTIWRPTLCAASTWRTMPWSRSACCGEISSGTAPKRPPAPGLMVKPLAPWVRKPSRAPARSLTSICPTLPSASG